MSFMSFVCFVTVLLSGWALLFSKEAQDKAGYMGLGLLTIPFAILIFGTPM